MSRCSLHSVEFVVVLVIVQDVVFVAVCLGDPGPCTLRPGGDVRIMSIDGRGFQEPFLQ